jgi:2-methylcitrate dehydratase PrpD
VHLSDGRVLEERQAFFKGGAEHPLSDADLTQKFQANCRHGGVDAAQTQALLDTLNAALLGGTLSFSAMTASGG